MSWGFTSANPEIYSFQNLLFCNRKRHRTLCSNSTGGYVLGFRPALPLTGDGGFNPGGYVQGVMTANHPYQQVVITHMQLRAARSRCTKRIDDKYCIPWPTCSAIFNRRSTVMSCKPNTQRNSTIHREA